MKRILILGSTLAALVLPLSACHPYHNGPGYAGGPPAHAPAHGYRKQHGGRELSYDSGLGVYVVIGSPSIYYWDNVYWRLRDGIWLQASLFDGPWIVVENSYQKVPPGLAKKHGYGNAGNSGNSGNNNSKANEKAKGKDKNKNK